MTIYTFTNRTVADADEVNTTMKHSITSGTATVSFTPTDATTNLLIIAKGNMFRSNTEMSGDVNLTSDVDGTLDTVAYNQYKASTSNLSSPFTLTYSGTASATAHSLSLSFSGGSQGAAENVKINVLEF